MTPQKAQIGYVAKVIKDALDKDDAEVYFRDDGDTCTVDGHVNVNALARAVIEALSLNLIRCEFMGRPCVVLKSPDGAAGLMDVSGDYWIMRIEDNEQPVVQRMRPSEVLRYAVEW